MCLKLLFSAVLTAIVFLECITCCCDEDYNIYSEESKEAQLNASLRKIHDTQRFLTDQPICGTITVEYIINLLTSTIQLGSNDELFTVIGNQTRAFWIENVVSFTGTTASDNCVYFLCGRTLAYVNEDIGPCELSTYFMENDNANPSTLKEATSVKCVCSDPECEKRSCSNVKLEPDECARLYTETFCQECYSESIRMPRIGNGSKSSLMFSEYLTKGNYIKSAVVNEGCEVWIEESAVYRRLALQTLKSGSTNTLMKLDPDKDIAFKCYNIHPVSPPGVKESSNESTIRSAEVTAIVLVTILIIVLLATGIFLAWRKSANIEKEMRERTIPKIDLDEFFNGKPIAPKTSPELTVRTARDMHYATIAHFKNRKLSEGQCQGTDNEEEQTIDIALSQPYQWKWEIPKRFIKKFPDLLGKGEFGEVFTGLLDRKDSGQSRESIAIKEAQRQFIKPLLMEIKILSYIGQHPNIVNMLGASVSDLRKGKSNSVWLVLELCPNGSLKSFLDKQRSKLPSGSPTSPTATEDINIEIEVHPSKKVLCHSNLCKWALDIALGMEFLEQKKILHIDLATRNVLLDENLVAKIGDFGSARKLYSNVEYWKYLNPDGTPNEPLAFKWMALESLQKLVFTSKSDVWSYGVTIWEIFEYGREPYPQFRKYESLEASLNSGMRLPQPSTADDHTYATMRRCWDQDPGERPTFVELQKLFQDLLKP